MPTVTILSVREITEDERQMLLMLAGIEPDEWHESGMRWSCVTDAEETAKAIAFYAPFRVGVS